MASRNSSIDWPRIELEYLAGEDSIREIADRHEISEGAIRKRAKLAKWVRAVRTPKKLRTFDEMSPEIGGNPPPPARTTPDTPVDSATIADTSRALVARMLDELDTVTSRRGELEDMIVAATDDDDDDGKRDAMMKAISLPGRANTIKTLALALKTINEASAPQGKKAAAQEKANRIGGGGARFAPMGPPQLKSVK